jgi:DNA-binding beta-propeller fold protein YncE
MSIDRKIKLFFIPFYIILSALAGCQPGSGGGKEEKILRRPQGLVFQTKIEGVVLGQKISRPQGVAADNYGGFYLIDGGNNRVIRFDSDFKPISELGGFGSSAGSFSSPGYCALNNSLNIYISDPGNRRIVIANASLNYVDAIDLYDEEDLLKYGRPSGLTINDYGELWVGDADHSRVAIFNTAGKFDRFIGGAESSFENILNPKGLRRDKEGNIYICDAGNGVVKIFNRSGIIKSTVGDEILKKPSGIDCDKAGNIWIADAGLKGIIGLSSSGQFLHSSADDGQNDDFRFEMPFDLTITPNDILIISDSERDRIMIYKILYF